MSLKIFLFFVIMTIASATDFQKIEKAFETEKPSRETKLRNARETFAGYGPHGIGSGISHGPGFSIGISPGLGFEVGIAPGHVRCICPPFPSGPNFPPFEIAPPFGIPQPPPFIGIPQPLPAPGFPQPPPFIGIPQPRPVPGFPQPPSFFGLPPPLVPPPSSGGFGPPTSGSWQRSGPGWAEGGGVIG